MDPNGTTPPASPACRFGWYGKLPTLGDFASRRLTAELIEGWDDWLAAGLAHWREGDPDGWLEAYLSGSSWRFVALPGTLPGGDPARAHAGVLMPSVDRVGRYFPFTVMWQVDRLPQWPAALEELLRTLQDIDDLAIDALQDDWTVDQLEAELVRLEAVLAQASAAHARGAVLAAAPGQDSVTPLGPTGNLVEQFGIWGAQALMRHWQGCVVWLSDPGNGVRELRITHGLPQREAFAQLLRGNARTGSGGDGAAPAAPGNGWD